MRLLRINAVAERVEYHPVHVRRLIRNGNFPSPIRLGENRVAWIEAEIEEWLEGKRQERDAKISKSGVR
jgi:prophage regulatory protein